MKKSFLFRSASFFVLITFICSMVVPPSYAQVIAPSALSLPIPGTLIPTSEGFNPTIIRGLTLHMDNPLEFDFIIDTGETGLLGEDLKEESNKLVKYFLASLTTPEEEMWVNLSPYENDRIIPESFGITSMGRDLLVQDYMLKQLSSSMMYPENDLGEEFWDRIYERAQEEYGTTDIPMNTFNKIWIIPEKAVLYEQGQSVYVLYNKLKVMMEEDYIALQNSRGEDKYGMEGLLSKEVEVVSEVNSAIIKEILIPEIEHEINTGKTFANLRQIYSSMVLATWYKKNLKESLLGQVYANQNKTLGVDIEDKEAKQKIFEQYVESFKTGVFNYVKESYDPATQQIIPRKYFSGGANGYTDSAMITTIKELDQVLNEKPEVRSAVRDVLDRFIDNDDGYETTLHKINLKLVELTNESVSNEVLRAKFVNEEGRIVETSEDSAMMSVEDWEIYQERINEALVESGYSINVQLGVENAVSVEIQVPAIIGSEGFIARGSIDFSNEETNKVFERMVYDMKNIGEGYGMPKASIQNNIRKLGVGLTDREVTEPAKQRTIDQVLMDLQTVLPKYDYVRLVEEKGEMETAQEFLDVLQSDVEQANNMIFENANEVYGYTDTLSDYDVEGRRKQLAFSFFYNGNGYPMGRGAFKANKAIQLMKEYYTLNGDLAMTTTVEALLDRPFGYRIFSNSGDNDAARTQADLLLKELDLLEQDDQIPGSTFTKSFVLQPGNEGAFGQVIFLRQIGILDSPVVADLNAATNKVTRSKNVGSFIQSIQTKDSFGVDDYHQFDRLVLNPLVEIFSSENIDSNFNKEVWESFQNGTEVEGQAESYTLTLLNASRAFHGKVAELFERSVREAGNEALLYSLARETHNAWYANEKNNMGVKRDVDSNIATSFYIGGDLKISNDEVGEFIGGTENAEAFKDRFKNPESKFKLSMEDVFEDKRADFIVRHLGTDISQEDLTSLVSSDKPFFNSIALDWDSLETEADSERGYNDQAQQRKDYLFKLQRDAVIGVVGIMNTLSVLSGKNVTADWKDSIDRRVNVFWRVTNSWNPYSDPLINKPFDSNESVGIGEEQIMKDRVVWEAILDNLNMDTLIIDYRAGVGAIEEFGKYNADTMGRLFESDNLSREMRDYYRGALGAVKHLLVSSADVSEAYNILKGFMNKLEQTAEYPEVFLENISREGTRNAIFRSTVLSLDDLSIFGEIATTDLKLFPSSDRVTRFAEWRTNMRDVVLRMSKDADLRQILANPDLSLGLLRTSWGDKEYLFEILENWKSENPSKNFTYLADRIQRYVSNVFTDNPYQEEDLADETAKNLSYYTIIQGGMNSGWKNPDPVRTNEQVQAFLDYIRNYGSEEFDRLQKQFGNGKQTLNELSLLIGEAEAKILLERIRELRENNVTSQTWDNISANYTWDKSSVEEATEEIRNAVIDVYNQQDGTERPFELAARISDIFRKSLDNEDNNKSIEVIRDFADEDKAQIGEVRTVTARNNEEVGGIDLNPDLLDLQIKRDGSGVPLPVWDQSIDNLNIDGFLPVIINVSPAILNLPMLSG